MCVGFPHMLVEQKTWWTGTTSLVESTVQLWWVFKCPLFRIVIKKQLMKKGREGVDAAVKAFML